jgi:D-glycero-D-manno-heptose 1,7-bisphosphate phosphatase
MKRIDAIILAGGYGSRISKVTKNKIPKSLLNINKKPFLDYLLKKISKYPFNKIIIVAGLKGRQIFKMYNKKKINLIDIECFVEKKPKGTGVALNFIKKKIKNDFVLFNGDTFSDYKIENFFKNIINKKFIGKIILTSNNKKSLTKNLVNLNIDNKNIVNFSKKTSLISTGIIFFKKNIKNYLTKKIISFENDVLRKLIINRKMTGEIDKSFFIDIGTERNLNLARDKLPKIFHKPALFLDRDGVINKDFNHTHTIKNLSYNKRIFPIIKKFQKNNFFIFIVTNQAGIAKGYYTLNNFLKFQNHIKKDLFKKGVYVNDIEFCPHHENGKIKKYKIYCNCRKPKVGMINNLKDRWTIDIKKSLFIGDKITDKICAENSALNFVYFKNISQKISTYCVNYNT